MKLDIESKNLIKKLIYEAEEALKVLKQYAKKGVKDLSDIYALRYSIIQIVESIALIASRIAETRGTVIEGYTEAMKFLARTGIVKAETGEKLVKLARLRNLIVHRYWVINDERILKEARENGIEAIEEAIENVRKLVEG